MTQERALEILKTGKNACLTGEPGSGKSYVIGLFTDWLRKKHRVFSVTATTGIAATHVNGTTIHSWSGLGIKEDVSDAQIREILSNKWRVGKMRYCETLIIDEISMMGSVAFAAVDRILRALRDPFLPFGGIQVVFVGDFFQLPPVGKDGKSMPYAFESPAWDGCGLSYCYLTEQHRQSDPEHMELLRAFRAGTMTHDQIRRIHDSRAAEMPPTRLFTHNREVDTINVEELAKVRGEERVFMMESGGLPFLVDTLKRGCLSPERLVLRIGAVVMFTRNDKDGDYANGDIADVIAYQAGSPTVRVRRTGEEVRVRAAEWSIEDTKAWISQLPLRLAWAITIHKSQGMSLDSATMDLSRCFAHGQGYVAVSRVRSLAGLHVEGMNAMSISMDPKVAEKDAEFRRLSELNE